MAKKKKKDSTFRFMDLPTELRCLVYSYLLQGRCPIRITYGYPKANSRARAMMERTCRPDISAAMLLVNRQIYKECVSSLYSANTFTMHDARIAKFFVRSIGNNSRYLKSIEIDRTGPGLKTYFADFVQTLKSAKHLEVLCVPGGLVGRVNDTWSYSPDRLVALIASLLRVIRDTQPQQMLRQKSVTSDILILKGRHARSWGEIVEAGATDPCYEVKQLLAQVLGESLMEAV